MNVKVDIFSGFLGVGKTTLIKKLLQEKYYSKNTAIIENEFGKVAIDGTFLRQADIKVKEINSGCICCTITGDFQKALKDIYEEFTPERIIIEPSGVGKLSEVLSAIKNSELKSFMTISSIITVVDVTKFNIYITNFGEFYKDQIKSAETVVLTRTEFIDEDKIKAIVADVKKLNSSCSIITTPIEELSAEKIMNSAKVSFEKELLTEIVSLKRTSLKIKNAEINRQAHRADEIFDSWGIETPVVYDKNELIKNINSLKNEGTFGIVLRAKGIVRISKNNWIEFDYVPGELNLRETAADYPGKLCVIGSKLNKRELENLFKA
jgi:G3E family GTPase